MEPRRCPPLAPNISDTEASHTADLLISPFQAVKVTNPKELPCDWILLPDADSHGAVRQYYFVLIVESHSCSAYPRSAVLEPGQTVLASSEVE